MSHDIPDYVTLSISLGNYYSYQFISCFTHPASERSGSAAHDPQPESFYTIKKLQQLHLQPQLLI